MENIKYTTKIKLFIYYQYKSLQKIVYAYNISNEMLINKNNINKYIFTHSCYEQLLARYLKNNIKFLSYYRKHDK